MTASSSMTNCRTNNEAAIPLKPHPLRMRAFLVPMPEVKKL